MRYINIGLLAHVDAGKTTLAENILYTSGAIRTVGRVDHGDTYLDNNEMERSRGITIFSKQARFKYGDMDVTLLDTPGHVDFSSEMERVLSVIDLAVLIISGPEGVQSHTGTLWRLLEHYDVPTVIFVNKMDMQGADRDELMNKIRESLSENCVDMAGNEAACEEIAMSDEELMEEFLETGSLSSDSIRFAVENRLAFPVWFGSALRSEGVKELLDGISEVAPEPDYSERPEEEEKTGIGWDTAANSGVLDASYGARVFKITRSASGERLTHMKITYGKISPRMIIEESEGEKIDQIRLYNGEKYETVSEAAAGQIVAWAACSARSAGTAGAACAIAIYAAADVHEHGHHCKHARHARPADAAADVSRAFRLPAVRASRPIAIPDVSAAGEPACSVCHGQCAADLHCSADGGGAAVETRPPQAGRTAAGTGDAWLGIAGDRRIWLVRHYDAG